MKNTLDRTPRYGNYHVTRLAATPREATAAAQSGFPSKPARWQTLWAERPLELPHGRALGLRQRGETVEVAFLAKATLSMRWEPFEKVLTYKQAQAWRLRSAFTPR